MSGRVGLEMIVDSVGDLEVAGHASDGAQAAGSRGASTPTSY